jgi:hypothetical protein
MSDHGITYATWILCRPKVAYHGAYPSGFLHRARRQLGVRLEEPLLHVCGGRARCYSKPEHGIRPGVPVRGFGPNDKTLDLDPALEPDFLQDAREPFPLQPDVVCLRNLGGSAAALWPGILIDRPYTREDADHYAPGREALPELSVLLRNARDAVKPGGRVGVIDYLWGRPAKGLECIFVAHVLCGFDNRSRAFSVYERVEETP